MGKQISDGVLFPGERRTFAYEKCDAVEVVLQASGIGKITGSKTCFENYSLTVSLGEWHQELIRAKSVCQPNLPQLLWAGDLEGDEVIDLLIDLGVNEQRHVLLMTSGKGTKETPLRKIAEHSVTVKFQ